MKPIKTYLGEELPLPRADCILLVLSFGTAIIDSFTFPRMGVFVANMTGNSVFLGLSIAGLRDPQIHASRSITSLCCFWLGSFVTGQVGHRIGPKKRWWLFAVFTFQSCIVIFLASIILYTHTVSISSSSALGLIAPLAFIFGSQAAASRPLGVAPITTVVVTSAMVDLFADKNFFAPLTKNVPRNQRLAFILTFFVGGIVGSLSLLQAGDAFTVLLSGIVKLVGALLFLVAPGKKENEVAVEPGGPAEAHGEVEMVGVPEGLRVDSGQAGGVEVGREGSRAGSTISDGSWVAL